MQGQNTQLCGLIATLVLACLGQEVPSERALSPLDSTGVAFLKRLPAKVNVLIFCPNGADTKVSTGTRDTRTLKSMLVGHTQEATSILFEKLSISEALRGKFKQFKSEIIFFESPTPEEYSDQLKSCRYGVVFMLEVDDSLRPWKTDFLATLAKDMDKKHDSEFFQLFRTKKTRPDSTVGFVAVREFDSILYVGLSADGSHFDGLVSQGEEPFEGLNRDLLQEVERHARVFADVGFMQCVSRPGNTGAHVSTYLPSGAMQSAEIRRFKEKITPAYFPSFKDRIGKREKPAPKWATMGDIDIASVEATIQDENTYQVLRNAKEGELGRLAIQFLMANVQVP